MNDDKENHNSISTSQFLNKMIFFRGRHVHQAFYCLAGGNNYIRGEMQQITQDSVNQEISWYAVSMTLKA
jgi:hypothetical protein